MKKFITIFLASVIIFSFTACDITSDDKRHDETLSEIAQKNGQYHEKRKAFLLSQTYKTAYAYVGKVLNEILPECEIIMSLEPGNLIESNLSEFSDFRTNKETRIKFFSQADLYISVNFWDFKIDPLVIGDKLIEHQISTRLAADEYSQDVYHVDAKTGKSDLEIIPGV